MSDPVSDPKSLDPRNGTGRKGAGKRDFKNQANDPIIRLMKSVQLVLGDIVANDGTTVC